MMNLPVTPVSERCDNETSCVAQVLVAILQHGVDHTSHHVSFLSHTKIKREYHIYFHLNVKVTAYTQLKSEECLSLFGRVMSLTF